MANTTADKTPISLDNLARNNERMKEYIQSEIDKIPNSTVDDTLSDTSKNPVQNKVVNAALNEKASKDIMTGATLSAAGTSGLVPAPTVDDIAKFLCGDGTWKSPDSSCSGEGYQMPYYIQGGTVSVEVREQPHITFPKAFKEPPLVFFNSPWNSLGWNTTYFGRCWDLTETGFTLFINDTNGSMYSGTVQWIAFGELA